MLWTSRQRSALFVIVAALVGWIGVQLFRNRAYVADPQPPEPELAAELADRIDLNTADLATLAALPQIGEKRAQLILEYRARATRAGETAFARPEDLLRIRGIGSATVDQLRPFLSFPGREEAATQPSPRSSLGR